MKLFFALCFSLSATAALACTDLSGTYRDDNSETFTLVQSGCESVTVNDSSHSETMITDGVPRVISEDDSSRITASATFVGDNLTVDGNIELKVALPPEFPTDKVPKRVLMIYTKASNGDLLINTTIYNSTGAILGTQSSVEHKI
jgi:hypothetical protein